MNEKNIIEYANAVRVKFRAKITGIGIQQQINPRK